MCKILLIVILYLLVHFRPPSERRQGGCFQQHSVIAIFHARTLFFSTYSTAKRQPHKSPLSLITLDSTWRGHNSRSACEGSGNRHRAPPIPFPIASSCFRITGCGEAVVPALSLNSAPLCPSFLSPVLSLSVPAKQEGSICVSVSVCGGGGPGIRRKHANDQQRFVTV